MGLDPNNITYDALFNRLLEIVLANITLANMFGLVGAIFFVATLLMQTMVPLRVANMVVGVDGELNQGARPSCRSLKTDAKKREVMVPLNTSRVHCEPSGLA